MLSPSSYGISASDEPTHKRRRMSSPGDGVAVSPTDDAASTPAKRFQVPRACRRCKTLRRGCSEYRPCKRCTDAGVADQCLGSNGHHHSLRRPSLGSSAALPFYNSEAEDALLRMKEIIRGPVVDHCINRFFDRLFPTIPLLTADYVVRLKATALAAPETPGSGGPEACCVLVAMCAQVLLQAKEPENLFQQGIIHERNEDFGCSLVAAALAVHQCMPRRPSPTLDQCLLTFFLYACQARLSHHSQAFFLLREATTLFILLRPSDSDESANKIVDRLFWVLMISERSHAIRYRRPITLQITAERLNSEISREPSLTGFWSLASLFRPIDTAFVALINEEAFSSAIPSPDSIDFVETAVNTAIRPSPDLLDTQKANLRVTMLWLRVIIWQLRLRLGYLREESYQRSLIFQYPLDIGHDLKLSTRDLPIESIKVHGVGLTEKLFDVASAVVDVMARVPLTASSPRGRPIGPPPEDDLVYLRDLITQLPGGKQIYDDLLNKHVEQALPGMLDKIAHRTPT